MKYYPIDVSSSGAVLLGSRICCDGFHRDYQARVQTHIHLDHMDDFETSKGFQDLFMSKATKRMLVAEFNADLPFRSNVYTLETGVALNYYDDRMEVVESGHMLGSVQVAVELSNGMKLGYSGDFQWPLDRVIQAEAVVVDSTYGSPESRRTYSQGEVEANFLGLVVSKLRGGPLHILAHRGTLHRALQVLSGAVNCRILGSPRLCAEVEVYREFGYGIGPILSTDSVAAKEAIAQGRFIRFYGLRDGFPVDPTLGTTVALSAHMSDPRDPILEYSERSYRVALSNHADFEGTLEYVKATGAKYVLTDNTRGGHAVELALEIKSELGIEAEPSSHGLTREWGI